MKSAQTAESGYCKMVELQGCW